MSRNNNLMLLSLSAAAIIFTARAAMLTIDQVTIGVDAGGQLNEPYALDPVGVGSLGLRATFDGITYTSTEKGCDCEGWGASAYGTSTGGKSSVLFNNDDGLTGGPGLTDVTSTTATAISATDRFTIRHGYQPSGVTNVFKADISIVNTGFEDLSNVRYRRVMDWDIDPTAFSERVTIDWSCGTDIPSGSCSLPTYLEYFSDNGFDTSDPESFSTGAGLYIQNTRMIRFGPKDHGAAFTFNFGSLSRGSTVRFKIFYGAGPNEATALTALASAGAEVWSLGLSNTPNEGRDSPVFFFGFANVGGCFNMSVYQPNIVLEDTTGATSIPVTFSNLPEPATMTTCGISTISCTPTSGSLFAVGTTTPVSCAVSFVDGSSIRTWGFTVTVNDRAPPSVTVPAPITVEATGPGGATVTFGASGSDAVGATVVTCTPSSGSTFAITTTTVTCVATDAAGNSGSQAFTVTVADTTRPVVTVPAPITVRATGPGGATVTFSASVSDAVGATVTCTPSSGSTFAITTTTVTCLATDAAGNSGSQAFTVTVVPSVCNVTDEYPRRSLQHGPFGKGLAGNYFNTTSDYFMDSISEIGFLSRGTIWAFQVSNRMSGPSPRYGGAQVGKLITRQLEPNEYIISARVAYQNFVWGMTFNTSNGRTLVVGQPPSAWLRLKVVDSPGPCGSGMFLRGFTGIMKADGCLEQVNLIWGTYPLPFCPSPSAAISYGDSSDAASLWYNPRFNQSSAQFIWSNISGIFAPLSTFKKSFFVSPRNLRARLHLVVDDFAEVYLNGALVGQFSGGYIFENPYADPYADRPATLNLQSGLNTLAIRATNGDSGLAVIGAMAAALTSMDNKTVLVYTDTTWNWHPEKAADVLGLAGMAPWGSTAFPDTTAKWIWSHPDAATAEGADPIVDSHTFSRVFFSTTYSGTAYLHVMVDQVAAVFVNMEHIGSVNHTSGSPLTLNLRSGRGNFISIDCLNNDGGSAGLLAALYAADNTTLLLHTDETWAYSSKRCQPRLT